MDSRFTIDPIASAAVLEMAVQADPVAFGLPEFTGVCGLAGLAEDVTSAFADRPPRPSAAGLLERWSRLDELSAAAGGWGDARPSDGGDRLLTGRRDFVGAHGRRSRGDASRRSGGRVDGGSER